MSCECICHRENSYCEECCDGLLEELTELREAAGELVEQWLKDSFPLGKQEYDERRQQLAKCATQLRALLAKLPKVTT